jgi:hypothetical protein
LKKSPRGSKTSKKRLRSTTLETHEQWISFEQERIERGKKNGRIELQDETEAADDRSANGFGMIWKGIQQLFR